MDTLPLPPSPDLGQYRKRAKELVAAACSGEEAVRAWAADWLEAIARLTNELPTPFVASSYERAVDFIAQRLREQQTFALANAQFLVARAHGFANWAAFARHVERLSVGRDDFEDAADAVVDGDLAALESLLRAHPGLVHSRSARVHRATLLHYVAANGVEDFRQKTPSNAVAIARLLLESGAVVDAPAETYGGGTSQTTMNLLVSSTHPADAGLQPALVETLVDHGGRGRRARGRRHTADDRPGVRVSGSGEHAGSARREGRQRAGCGGSRPRRSRRRRGRRPSAAGRSLRVGVPVRARNRRRAPAGAGRRSRGRRQGRDDRPHWAAAGRHLEAAGLLIRHGAPLEARNRWGGTVLSSTVFLALQRPAQATLYVPVLERLIAAGADVRAVERPTGNAALDTVLATT
jgi:hypothetical protein